MKTFHVTFT